MMHQRRPVNLWVGYKICPVLWICCPLASKPICLWNFLPAIWLKAERNFWARSKKSLSIIKNHGRQTPGTGNI